MAGRMNGPWSEAGPLQVKTETALTCRSFNGSEASPVLWCLDLGGIDPDLKGRTDFSIRKSPPVGEDSAHLPRRTQAAQGTQAQKVSTHQKFPESDEVKDLKSAREW